MALIITSPAAGAIVSGTITLVGTDGGVTGEVMNGTTVIGTVVLVQPVPFSVPVDTTKLTNGAQTLSFSDGTNVASVSVVVNNVITLPVSPSGSTIPSLTEIVDSNQGAWTLVSGVVYLNGVAAGFTSQVTTLLYYNGVMWQENAGNLWWPWNSTSQTWTGTGVADPRPAAPALSVTTPASGATASSPVAITGTTNQASVVVSEGGATLATITPSGGAFSGSVVLATGAHNLEFSAGTATPVMLAVTVAPVTVTNAIPFYGVGCHFSQGGIYTSNFPQQVADCQYMGAKAVRQDLYSASQATALATLIPSFSPIVIQPMCGMTPSQTASETTSYNTFYTFGQACAQAFAGKVPLVEMMNEPENQYFSAGGTSGDGNTITQWASVNSQWPSFRGACRGFVDGFRNIDPNKQTLIASPSVSWLHYGLLDGLWNGTAPDGTSGHPTCRWDVTNQHWYYDMGNIEAAGGSSLNVLQHHKTTYGLPIMLTEVGVQYSLSESAIDSYFTTEFTWYATTGVTKYGVIGFNVYELYNFDNNSGFLMGLYSSPGTKNAGRADALKAVIAANPK